MVQKRPTDTAFPAPRPGGLFHPEEPPVATFPIQSVQIDWDRLIAKRPTVLATIDDMPAYLLKPEVLALLDEEKVSAPESTPFFRTPSATDFLLSHHNAGECHGPDRQY